jgi:hypothetical protein
MDFRALVGKQEIPIRRLCFLVCPSSAPIVGMRQLSPPALLPETILAGGSIGLYWDQAAPVGGDVAPGNKGNVN